MTIFTAIAALTISTTAAVLPAWEPAANWRMNEPAGSTVLIDSSPNSLDGIIGAKVFPKGRWLHFNKVPYTAPLDPQRTVRIPDSPALSIAADEDFRITWRQRTTKTMNGANIMQKGQGSPKGGMFKFKNGLRGRDYMRTSCFWRGSEGGAFTETPAGMDFRDGKWHTITCGRINGQVIMRVDGVLVDIDDDFGAIDNTWPLVFGGNITKCESTSTDERHCNYWAGDLNFVKIARR